MQNGTHVPKTRPAAILLLAVIVAAVAALSLHTGSATYAQTEAVSTPTAPRLSARSAGADAIELSWTAVPGADRYELHRQEADDPGWQQIDDGNLRGTSFTDRELTAGVTYQYAVRAIDGNGEPLGPWSNFPKETVSGSGASTPTPTATAAQTAAVSTVTAPRLSARSAGADAIELSWTAVPGADRYELHRQEVAAPGWQQIDDGALRGTSFRDGGLTAGVTYQYAVRAIDGNGEPLGPWSNFPKETVSGSGASTPTPTSTPTQTATAAQTAAVSTVTAPRLSARSAGANAIELSWTEVPGAARYALFRQEVAAPGWQQIDDGNLRGASFRDGGLTAGVTYQYAVRAIDGNGEPLGPWSNFPKETVSGSGASTPTPTLMVTSTPTRTATAAQTAAVSTPTAPRLSARSAGANAIELSWTAVPGAVRYALFRQEADDPGWQQIDDGALRGTSFTDRELTPGVTYQYAVRAIDGNGEPLGPWSNFPKETVSGSGASTTERGALIALYEATGGAGWSRNGNWLSDKPLDSWDGVTTDANGRVAKLDLGSNRLTGQLPDLSALSNLTHLNVSVNEYLSGPIPDLSALSNLTELTLSYNPQMGGPIPDLSALTNLRRLQLHFNDLSGPIPDLSALSNLERLSLNNNRLSGPVPGLNALSNLKSLSLGYNDLSGPIPDLNALSNLKSLSLGNNDLSGPIPDLNALSNLTELRLSENDLSGPIPDLSALSDLEILDLGLNDLSGEIPDLSAHTDLTRLDLSHNRLSGEIPDLSAHTDLTWLNLSRNRLSGEIPDLGTHTDLTRLDLSHNRLSGTVFALNHLPNLSTLDLSHNQLSGPVPDLGPLASLTSLDLAGNRFCLPAGYDPSGASAVVTEHLNGLNPAPCTEAELATVPDAPQNLAAAIGGDQVTLTWSAAPDAAGYELWVWDSLDREWEAAGGALTETTYTHSVLRDGRNYYYQVRTRFANGVRSPWSQRAGAIIVPGRFPPPPRALGLHLYYQKYLAVGNVVVIAATEVSDEKMEKARAIVSGMLSGNAGLLENSSGKYIRIAIYKQDRMGRHSSQVPEYLNNYPDAPGVAVRIPSGWIAIAPQDDRRCGVFIHEFAHTIQFAIEDQPGGAEFGSRLEGLYAAALDAGLWEGHYAVFTVQEYWAETVRFWFQGRAPDSLLEGPTKLADYDPEIARLIAEVFGDASVPEACQVPPSEDQPSLLYPRLPPLEDH